jgi:hypothetical protein
MNFCDEDFCWLCSTSGSCCNCEFSDSPWSKPASQVSFYIFDGCEKPGNFDVDELAFRAIDGSYFLGPSFENPDFDIDDMVQCPGRGSQQPCAVSTPKNNGYGEKWESPSTKPPPDSSSPVGLHTDSSPLATDPVLVTRMLRREDPALNRLLFCRPRDDSQSRVKAPFNDLADSNTLIFPTTTSMSRSPPLPTDTSESSSSMPAFSAAQESLDERLYAISTRQVVADDICVVTTRTAIEQTNHLERPDEIDRVSALEKLIAASRKRATFSGPTILDLAISTELEPDSSHGAVNDGLSGATTTSRETKGVDAVLSKMPPRRVSTISVSCPDQVTPHNGLKRRRSSVDYPPESKKVKLDRTVSHVSCASDSSVQSKYQATEPASIRRARSLRSEVSACSGGSTVRSLSSCIQEGIHQCAYMRPSLPGFAFLPFPSELTDFPTLPRQGLSTDGSKHPTPQFRGLRPIKGEPSGSNARSLLPQILGRSRDSSSSHHRTTSTYHTHSCALR